MYVPVRMSPPSRVPSEAVADMRCSHVARRRTARALSFFSSTEPWPLKAMTGVAMKPMSGYAFYELGRAMTVRIRADARMSRYIFVTR